MPRLPRRTASAASPTSSLSASASPTTASASAIATDSNAWSPMRTERGPISIVRSGRCCEKNPLMRSVNCTPTVMSTSTSSTAERVSGELTAPMYGPT